MNTSYEINNIISSLMEEFRTVRSKEFSNKRTEDCIIITNKLYEIICQYRSYCIEFSDTLSDDQSKKLCYILYVKKEIEVLKDFNQYSIFNLIRAYCEWNISYINSIISDLLFNIFSIPSPCKFIDGDLYKIYRYMCENYPSVRTYDQSKMADQFSIFFNYYSNIIFSINNISPLYNKLQDRMEASFLGLAIGDSLGFLVEGLPRKDCEKYLKIIQTGRFSAYGIHYFFGRSNLPRYTEIKSDICFHAGQYTDDTQLCRELLKNILENGKFDPIYYTRRLVCLFKKSELLRDNKLYPGEDIKDIYTGIVGYGTATLKSIQCLSDGINWKISGNTSLHGRGNGGCMRVGPLGVLYFLRSWELNDIAIQQCVGTHGSSICKSSAVIIAQATRLACESSLFPWSYHIVKDPKIFCDRLVQNLYGIENIFIDAINQIPEFLYEKDELTLVKKITDKCKQFGGKLWHEGYSISPCVIQTVLFSLCCFLRNYDSYKDALFMAIRGGGDTDTVAAITGSITAARTGETMENVKVFDRNKWNNNDLAKLARDVFVKINN
jgi:ADP-ribosylglycohydrolase